MAMTTVAENAPVMEAAMVARNRLARKRPRHEKRLWAKRTG